MAKQPTWISNFFQSKEQREDSQQIKALEARLEEVVDEVHHASSYEAKFFDAEPSTFSSPGQTEIGGIDQMINNAVLQRLYLSETWVYIAVSAIAKTVGGLPLKLEKKKIVKRKIKNDITGEEEEVDEEHWVNASGEKLAKQFNFPNKFTTKAEFYTLLMIDLLTAGEYYIYLDSDQDLSLMAENNSDNDPNSPFGRLRLAMASEGPIKGMYRIPPALMKPVPNEDGYGLLGYVMQSDRGQHVYAAAEIVHVKLPNPLNNFVGLSPLIPAFKPVLLDRFSTEHMIRFYKTGARLGGIIETEKSLGKEQLGRFQRSFENNYTGRHNHHRTLILPPGMSYKQIEQNPAETALLEFCKYNREAVLSAYNVPPIKVGILDNANYANALVQLKIFFTDTVMPYLTFVEDGFNLKNTVMPDSGVYRVKFDLSEVEALKDDYAALALAAKSMIEAGLSVNEVRKRVWKLGPVKDGDKIKAIEDMDNASGGFPLFNLSAQEGETKEVDSQQGLLAGLAGPQITSVMNIIGRVNRGRLGKDAACEMLITMFGMARETAQKLLGIEPTPKAAEQVDAPAMAADLDPTGLTYSQRVAQLTELFMSRDKLPLPEAIRRAVEQAKQEGFDPEDPTDPNGGGNGGAPAPNSDGSGAPDQGTPPAKSEAAKPSLAEFITDALGKLSADEPVTAEFLTELTEIYKQQHGETTEKESELAPEKQYAAGMTKDQVVEHWKGFIDKTSPLIEKRTAEVRKFFKALKTITMNQLGGNLKAYGLHKARDKSDADEITDLKNYEKAIDDYIKEVDAALLEAFAMGYTDTLATFKFDVRNDVALKHLRKYAADKVKGIAETTRDQLRTTIGDAFDAGVPVNEVSTRIAEKFDEIDNGRAMTIARTETLTAVSMGREEKRAEFQREFPETKLKKMWVSAQDEKVRDSHQELDGVSVDADAEFKEGLKFPRDPDCTDPSEVINCRCTEITFAEEDQALIEETLPQKEDEEEKSFPLPLKNEKARCEECRAPHSETDCRCDDKGGVGSGCHGPNCGRKPSGRVTDDSETAPIRVEGNRERDRDYDDTPIRVGKPKPKK
jgi:HK97 family phage portal protein